MTSDRERWNDKYRRGIHHDSPSPRLLRHLSLLTRGRALDVAGGLGENAAVLAREGWRTVMADVSDEAVAHARKHAADVRVVHADASHLPFGADFDTVVCTYFLDRAVELSAHLKPGGTLYIETFTVEDLKYAPNLPRRFCLEADELRRLYPALRVIHYAEIDDGKRAFATYVGRKSG